MTSVRLILVAGAVSAGLVTAAGAQSVPLGGMITGNDMPRIMELAGAYGPVEQRQDDDGYWIRGEMDSTVYTISFLNCNDQHMSCTTVQFRAWWESEGAHTMEAMNQWNRDRRFAEAYLDSNNNATIEWDVNLAGGVTAVNFDDSIQWWQSVLQQFREQVIDPGFGTTGGTGGSTTPPAANK